MQDPKDYVRIFDNSIGMPHQCEAITAKGTRCTKIVVPDTFDLNEPGLCGIHSLQKRGRFGRPRKKQREGQRRAI